MNEEHEVEGEREALGWVIIKKRQKMIDFLFSCLDFSQHSELKKKLKTIQTSRENVNLIYKWNWL